MRATAASSAHAAPADAVLEVDRRLRALGHRLGADGAALVFATLEVARDPEALSAACADLLGARPWIGFVGASVFHDVRLRERSEGLSVLLLDGVTARAATSRLDQPAGDVAAALLAEGAGGRARFVAVAADASTPGQAVEVLHALDDHSAPVAGSLCLAPPGQRASVLGRRAERGPRLALLEVDGVRLVPGVAQAARALGPPRWVTAADANLVQELDGRPAVEALLADLPPALRSRLPQLAGSLCAGFGVEEGDAFLMRNVVGLDPQTGAVAVAGLPKVGAEVVFSLRDQRAARTDLEEMLQSLRQGLGAAKPLAFVVFDCMARDRELFGMPNHDVRRLLETFGVDVPVVGVAGGGEICTYGARTHIFGSSCVVAALLPE
ncbi:MAG: FIST C-terminal domain-containing protein [Deltaproteobacteria bacterium]|nr:FIST C-terminal domain-containing protein [Deltaproteobacteria bacterium]